MASVWIMIKCDCGNHFGLKKGSHISCPRCGGKNEYIISKTFSSPNELHSAVSSANTPDDIDKIIKSKLKDLEKRRMRKDFQDGDISKLQVLMKIATDKNGILTIPNLISVLENNSVTNIDAEKLIQISELEGYIIRSDTNQWSWLQ